MRIIFKKDISQSIELTVDDAISIRDLRIEVAKLFNYTASGWSGITIDNILHADVSLGKIYLDTPADVRLVDFLKRKNANLPDNIDELKIYIGHNLGPYQYTITKYNPHGINVYCGNISYPDNVFLLNARCLIPECSFGARLKRIGYDLKTAKDVPAEFLDPITKKLMDDPVITSEQRTIDSSTLELVNYIDHVSGEKLTQHTIQNLRLRAEIEDFVSAKEKLYKQPYNIKEAEDNNAKPLLLSNPLSANAAAGSANAAAGSANLSSPAIAVSANGSIVNLNPNPNPKAAANPANNNAASVSASVSAASANAAKDPKAQKDVKSEADTVTTPSKASSLPSSAANNPKAPPANANAANAAASASSNIAPFAQMLPPSTANSASTSTASKPKTKVVWKI